MPYSAEISRSNPTCLLLMIDQSGSMRDVFPSSGKSKAASLADIVNRLVQNLVIKSSKSEGVRNYFHLGVLGYGLRTGAGFGGVLAGKDLIPISEVAENPVRIEDRNRKVDDGAGGLVEQKVKFPIWFDAVADGGTPMREAATIARSILERWLKEHASCFPPVVVHITDGESTDGDPSDVLRDITTLASSDGNVLLFNLHVSNSVTARKVEFPSAADQVPEDPYAQMLFATASELTPAMLQVARSDHQLPVADGARGFVLNGDPALIITALDIGTRSGNLR